jgi:beta-glucosidase
MKSVAGILMLMLALCIPLNAQTPSKDPKMDAFINKLMSQMTVEEKIGQLNLASGGGAVAGAKMGIDSMLKHGFIGASSGYSIESIRKTQQKAVETSRLHIPLLFGLDVIHGFKTIFPIPLGLSCSWDTLLIERSARIAANEASTSGISWTYSPMVDITRDPRWGRIAEGSGEDPWLASKIARSMVKGYQGNDLSKDNTILACVKHFALYGGSEAGRDYNTVDMSRITMYEDYFPPYKAAFDAGAGSAMSSFNVIDYIPASGNKWLLTEVLRKQWGFSGFVVSDMNAIVEMSNHGMGNAQEVGALALKAGLDMDMGSDVFFTTLKKSLSDGKVTQQEIDQSCRRVLEAKYKLGLFDDPYRYINVERSKTDIFTPDNLHVAREAARKSIVLLKNENQVLPVKKSGTIAVIGPLANSKSDMLGTWAFFGNNRDVITVYEGIKSVAGNNARVLYAKGSLYTADSILSNNSGFMGARNVVDFAQNEVLLKAALDTARRADVLVAVLGESANWSGEAASRSDIGLPECQVSLLKELLKTGKPVVLVLVNGRPLALPWEDAHVDAIVEAWNGGSEAGNAIADVLFGDYNPSGKLTATFPRSVGQIPIYYNHRNTGRPFDQKNKFTSKYLDISNDPLYPFGYGLSYATFEYGDIKVNKSALKGNETLTITAGIMNTGKYPGEETVQLYVQDPVASISRPVKELKRFNKVMLQPGEKKEITFTLNTDDLRFYNSDLKYTWEPGEFIIYVGTNSRDVKSVKINWLEK